jgi:hypothetical protein
MKRRENFLQILHVFTHKYAHSSENLSIRFSALSLFLLVCFASLSFSPDTDFVVFSMLAIISLQVPFGGTNVDPKNKQSLRSFETSIFARNFTLLSRRLVFRAS